jgi:pyruvate/2-oxoglutarate dehydrogenase complex dihydrolipoamide dehydrogenase (E3) component
MTAVQVALAMARRAPGTVTLLPRHPLREHQYDSDPCWSVWCVNSRFPEADYAQRRAIIQAARHRGSIPPEIVLELRHAVARGILRVQTAQVAAARLSLTGSIRLSAAGDAEAIQADRVVLATGFLPERPGDVWLSHTIAELGLACASCGYPIVDRSLRWRPGIYVVGALAELEIGPAARNLIGARLAAERIASAG